MKSKDRVPTLRAIPSLEAIEGKAFPRRVTSRLEPVLAFDLSTTCIGWAVATREEIVAYGKFVFADDRSMGDKLAALEAALCILFDAFHPGRVLVERPMTRRGTTTALHNQVLGVVRLVAYRHADIEILDSHLLSPITIKRKLGVKKGRDHDHNKEIMVNYVNEALGLSLKFHPHSKLQSQDDVADALAILLVALGLVE